MAAKFTFHPNLYLSEGITHKKLDKIKWMLKRRPLFANVYLIVPAHNPMDQLDIFDARELIQPHYKKSFIYVIGIASSQAEAILLVEKMVTECLKARGDCKLREYLSC